MRAAAPLEADVVIVGCGPDGRSSRSCSGSAAARRGDRALAGRVSVAARGALRPRGRAHAPGRRRRGSDSRADDAGDHYEWRNAAARPWCASAGRSRALGLAGRRTCSPAASSRPSSTQRARRFRASRRYAAGKSRCCIWGATGDSRSAHAEAAKRGAARALRDGMRRCEQLRARRDRRGWNDLGFSFDWLVVDVLPTIRAGRPINWQLCDPARPTTLVSGGPGRRRWEFMRLPHETSRS